MSLQDEGFQACEVNGHTKVIKLPGRTLHLPFGDQDIALASLLCSVRSMYFGLIDRVMRHLTVSIARTPSELSAPISAAGLRPSVVQALFGSDGSIRGDIRAFLNRSRANNPLANWSAPPVSRAGDTQESREEDEGWLPAGHVNVWCARLVARQT